ncbi:MAG: hypothetical protein M3512_04915 [Bacteroidota bacterium]|nr:hypothetical protein [Bacteroidota bacterium]
MPKQLDNFVKIDRHFYKRVLSDLYYLNGEIRALKPTISIEFTPINKTVKVIITHLDELKIMITGKDHDEGFKKCTVQHINHINDCCSKIINALQFQDIIEQKLQHIINVHLELIEEFYKEQALEKDNVDKDDLNNVNKVAQINSAQLKYIIIEYGEAVDCINKNKGAASKKLNELKLLFQEYKNKIDEVSNKIYNDLISSLRKDFKIQKEALSTPSNFVISIRMLDKVLEKLLVANCNEPFVIEGKWKKIFDMYTIESEKKVFESIAHLEQGKFENSTKIDAQDFELF